MAEIKFRLLRNVTVDVLDGQTVHVPMRQVTRTNSEGYELTKVEFDMEHVHTIKVPDLTFFPPRLPPGAPERMQQALHDAALARWIRDREAAEGTRKRLEQLQANGTISVVDDPTSFLSNTLTVSPEEVEVANAIVSEAEEPAKRRGAK